MSGSEKRRIAEQVERDGFGRLSIFGLIGDCHFAAAERVSGGGICARLDALRASGARSLLAVIDSPGGIISEGLAAYRALRRFSAEVGPVVVHVAGQASSMATVLAVAGDYVTAQLGSEFLIHHAQGESGPCPESPPNEATAKILATRTLLTAAELDELRDLEMVLDASSAEAHGIIDAITFLDHAESVALEAAKLGRLPGSCSAGIPVRVLGTRDGKGR